MSHLEEQLGINFDLYSALIVWALVFTRAFVMLLLNPFLGSKGVPGRVRLLVAGIIAVYVYFLLGEHAADNLPADKGLLIALFFKEIFFGMVIGLATVMTFYAVDAAGRIVDNQRGSANAQIFIPQLGQVSLFGLFEFQLGLAFFLSTGGHIIFLRAFLESYTIMPVLTFPTLAPGISPFMELLIRMSADVLILGMQLSAPVLIAIFITDVVLGLANKMAPQIPVFELGFMIKGYVGVAMVWISILTLISQMDVFFNLMQKNTLRMIHFFAS